MKHTNKRLFVYGIFLGESTRKRFGMTDPYYETVPDYITVGGSIVEAVPVDPMGIALTGLVVTPDETQWERLDNLEAGYDRVIVTTTSGEDVYMYVRQQDILPNYSTYVPFSRVRKERNNNG